MIYQEYFKQSDFEDIWSILNGFYAESTETKPLYEKLISEIVSLPIDEAHSCEKICLSFDCLNEIKVAGAPDPQEWLVGREVSFDFGDSDDEIPSIEDAPVWLQTFDSLTTSQKRAIARNSSVSEIAAHLLYWSTMYGMKTQTRFGTDFSDWLDKSSRGPYYDEEGNMVKYIFLDFDGVLNTEQYQAKLKVAHQETCDEYGPLFDPKAVEKLAEIIAKTKAKVVVTSSWRYIHDENALNALWKKRGLPGELYRILRTDSAENHRGKEIEEYMAHEINTPYVILDDLDEFLPSQKGFIHRDQSCCRNIE